MSGKNFYRTGIVFVPVIFGGEQFIDSMLDFIDRPETLTFDKPFAVMTPPVGNAERKLDTLVQSIAVRIPDIETGKQKTIGRAADFRYERHVSRLLLSHLENKVLPT